MPAAPTPASDPLKRALHEAVRHHQAGRLKEAEPLYRQVLKQSPGNFDALHLLGVVLSQSKRYDEAERLLRRAATIQPAIAAVQSNLGNLLRERGRAAEAIPFLRRALELDPKMAEGHHNLAVALVAVHKPEEAEPHFRRALELKPNYPEPCNSLGALLRTAGKLEESEAMLRRAIALRPNYVEALSSLGATLHLRGSRDEALEFCQKASQLRPDYAEGFNNLGLVHHGRKKLDLAEKAVREAIRLKPDYAEAHSNLGVVLGAAKRHQEAVAAYRTSLELKPDQPEAWMNLGGSLRELRKFNEAEAACLRSLELRPGYADAYCNLGVIHLDRGEGQAAVESYRQAVAAKPDSALAHWGLALALLVNGEYAEGWREYEWRWQCKDQFAPLPQLAKPVWDGSDLLGKTIFLHSEQGMGDAIQFSRYGELLAKKGARVILQCHPSLRTLLSTLDGVEQVIATDEKPPAFDCHASLLSMPLLCGTTVENIPAEVPYLHPDPRQVAAWKSRLAPVARRRLVGLAWAGNPEHQRDRERSCGLSLFAPLADAADVCFISLQKGASADEADMPPIGMNLLEFANDLNDFADTAALVANLDLVISVDTSVVHLAGAIGKPVWTLIAYSPDWRWLLKRSDAPWYPTMRLFRQERAGDWSGAIAAVAEALAKT